MRSRALRRGGGARRARRLGSLRKDHVRGCAVPGCDGCRHARRHAGHDHLGSPGVFRLAALADGDWSVRVEMRGFAAASRVVTIAAGTPPSTWELTLLPLEEITRGVTVQTFQRATVQASADARPSAAGCIGRFPGRRGTRCRRCRRRPAHQRQRQQRRRVAVRAAGGVRQQPPRQRSLYNGGLGVSLGNSAWDARPFSFTGAERAEACYNDVQFVGTFGGPLRIPGLLRNGPNVFVGVPAHVRPQRQHAVGADADRARARGDFLADAMRSDAGPALDPVTGLPFAGNVIPPDRISPQAAALLALLPAAEPRRGRPLQLSDARVVAPCGRTASSRA